MPGRHSSLQVAGHLGGGHASLRRIGLVEARRPRRLPVPAEHRVVHPARQCAHPVHKPLTIKRPLPGFPPPCPPATPTPPPPARPPPPTLRQMDPATCPDGPSRPPLTPRLSSSPPSTKSLAAPKPHLHHTVRQSSTHVSKCAQVTRRIEGKYFCCTLGQDIKDPSS
jgi:hypothetical protein